MSINIRFPIVDDTIKNRYLMMNNLSKDSISSNLMLLLLTEKGSRYYMPDYGSYLIKYIFESFDDLTIDDIEIDLVETINKYMPEITLVKLNKITIDEHHLQIDVFYTYKGINNSVEKIELVF